MYKKIERESFNPRSGTGRRIEDSEEDDNDNSDGLTYWDIVIYCMTKLGKQSIEEVNNMTLTEYFCLTHASHERDLYNEYSMHKQAFVSREIDAKKNVGTKKQPKEEWIFKTFEDFFDYEKALNDLRNFERDRKETIEKQEQADILNMLARNNKKRMNK